MSKLLYKLNATYNDRVLYEDKYYFSSNTFNGLFCFDKKSNEIVFKGIFPKEKALKPNLHQRIWIWKDKLVFAPLFADNISIFSPKTETFETIELDIKKPSRGMDSFLRGDWLWIFYCEKNHSAVRVNLQTCEIFQIPSYEEIYGKESGDPKMGAFTTWCFDGDYAWGAQWNGKNLLGINMDDCSFKMISVADGSFTTRSVTVLKNKAYILTWNYEIKEFDFEKNVLKDIEKESPLARYIDIYTCGEKIVLLPTTKALIGIIDANEGKVLNCTPFADAYRFIKEDDRKNWRSFMFCRYSDEDDNIFIPPYIEDRAINIDKNFELIYEPESKYDENMFSKLWEEVYDPLILEEKKQEKIINESETFSLSDFVRMI